MEINALWEMANLTLIVLGFSGVLGAMGRRAQGEWHPGDVKRFFLIVVVGLRLLFACLFPMVLFYFGLKQENVWAISSGIVGIVFMGAAMRVLYTTKRMPADEHSSKWVAHVVSALVLLSVFISFLNAFGVVFGQSFSAYFLVIMMTFSIAVIYLFRLIQTSFYSSNGDGE